MSNWDCSLADWLEPSGLLELVDGVVTSAETGAAKPDAAIFRRALELLGAGAGRCACTWATRWTRTWRAPAPRGSRAVLVARGPESPPDGVVAIRSLAELPSLV